jgi:hypothetical protein
MFKTQHANISSQTCTSKGIDLRPDQVFCILGNLYQILNLDVLYSCVRLGYCEQGTIIIALSL